MSPKTRIVASLDMESGAALRASKISAFLSIKYWSTVAIFEYLSDCTAAFGIRKPVLITSTKAMLLIILSLVAALIARCPFAVAARSLMISFTSAAGRISIVPQFNFTPGDWEMR
ncbi:MAG: hypothetical protein WBD87_05335 [Candidatus Acidiferrales bacterium]